MTMKIEDVPVELKDKAEFACKVCLAWLNDARVGKPKINTCNCREVLNEYCPYVEKVLAQESASKT